MSKYSKSVVALVNLVATVLTLALAQGDVIPESATKWVVLFLASVTTLGVYQVKNQETE